MSRVTFVCTNSDFFKFWSGSVSIPKQTYNHKHLHLPPRQNQTELIFFSILGRCKRSQRHIFPVSFPQFKMNNSS